MGLRKFGILFCHSYQFLIVPVEGLELFLGEIFDINQSIARSLNDGNYFIELQMDRLPIFVLCSLNQKYHQKRYNCGPGVDYELPCV